MGIHPTTHKFADRVRDSHDFEATIEEFPEGTKTVDDAAIAVGCDVAWIVKSIVMRVGDETVIVLTGDANRIDEASLGSEFDAEQDSVRSANPSEMEAATGWSIGGVSPTYRATDCPVLADPTFESLGRIWATAGTPGAVFQLTPDDLRTLSTPRFVDVFEWGERRIEADTRYSPPRIATRTTPLYPLFWLVGAKWVSLEGNSRAIVEPPLIVKRNKLSFRRK